MDGIARNSDKRHSEVLFQREWEFSSKVIPIVFVKKFSKVVNVEESVQIGKLSCLSMACLVWDGCGAGCVNVGPGMMEV